MSKQKDTECTRVVFRTWHMNGETIALFPDLPADMRGNCTSYQHIGQHGAADYAYVMANTEPATEREYLPLFTELESIGYNLDIQ